MGDDYWKTRDAESHVQIAIERLVGKYPFHASVLSRFTLQASWSQRTMAVAATGPYTIALLFSPEFVLGITLAELTGVLLHEVHHVVFGHLSMDSRQFPDEWALTVAQECTANEYVKEPLPGNPLQLKQFKLPPKESTDERYARLAATEKGKQRPQPIASLTLDDHQIWSSCDLDGEQVLDLMREVLQQAIEECGPDAIAEPLAEAVDLHVPGIATGYAKEGRGRHARGSLDWRTLLRRYCGQYLQERPVFNRPNRRFPELVGIVPGTIRSPSKPRVMAVVDTSGSITSRLLQSIDAELELMARAHLVLVVECDASIKRTYEYRRVESAWGRGGTNLCPPFEAAFLAKHRPDLIVYFTDGFGPAPDAAPPGVPVVWCLVPGGLSPAPWGRVIRIEEPSSAQVLTWGDGPS